MKFTVRYTERRDGGAVQSYSRQDPGHLGRLRAEGWDIYTPGNGWAYLTMPARILVELSEGRLFDLVPYFRGNIGRLTQKRVGIIVEEVPETIELVGEGLSESFLNEWLARVRRRI